MAATASLPGLWARHKVAAEAVSLRTAWIVCGALLALAAAYRVYLLSTVYANVDSDQAVLGIMAYHIQAGERPVFYYGQPYTGSLEAYLAALLFSAFGASDLTLRLPALAFSVAFVGVVYWLAATLYGLRIALLAGLFLALGPGLLISWSTAAGAGYVEAMVCGTLLLLLAVRYPDLRAMPPGVALAGGLLAGLGVWMDPLIVEYLLPLVVAYALPLLLGWATQLAGHAHDPLRRGTDPQARPDGAGFGWSRMARALVAIVAGIGVGAAPLLVYNLGHDWVTASFLFHYTGGGDPGNVAVRLVTQALPVVLGLAMPTVENQGPAVFARLTAAHPLAYLAGLVLGAYILGRLVLGPGGLPRRLATLAPVHGADDCVAATHAATETAATHAATETAATAETASAARARDAQQCRPPLHWSRPLTARDGVLALFALSCVLLFVVSHFGAMYTATRAPRYLLPLYTATPLVLDCLIPRLTGAAAPARWGPAHRRPADPSTWIAALATAALVTAGLSLTLATVPRPSIAGLAHLLEARRVRIVYANDYWIVYRISFETHERVLAIGVGDGLRLGLVRIPGYLDVAARTPAGGLAWVFFDGRPQGERNFRLLLQREHIRASRTVWADRVIYDHASRPLRASGPYASKGF